MRGDGRMVLPVKPAAAWCTTRSLPLVNAGAGSTPARLLTTNRKGETE